MRAIFEAVERIVLKLQSREVKGGRHPASYSQRAPALALRPRGKREGLSMGEKTHGDLLLLLFKSNYRNHKHMQKSSIINRPEIMMFNV